MSFQYQSFATNVSFGIPAHEVLEKTSANRVTKAYVIASTRNQDLVNQIRAGNTIQVVNHFSEIAQHVPQDLVDKAIDGIKPEELTVLIAIGGGSAIGLAKAIALRYGIPIWAVPTTYAGSEMTNIYGISSGGKKNVSRSNGVLPEVIIYDPALTDSLPLPIALTSATNALAHLIEGVYAIQNNPVSYQQSLIGIQHVLKGYGAVNEAGRLTPEANGNFLLGAYLGGKSLCELPMALHHKAAHVLGGNFGLDHASTHTVLLPFVFAYQWSYLSESIRADFITVFGDDDPPRQLLRHIRQLNVPADLQQIGFRETAINQATEQICALQFENPAPVMDTGIRAMLTNAYAGELARIN